MAKQKSSELQKKYRNFFLEKLESYGVTSPAQLSREEKSQFFTEIKNEWAAIKKEWVETKRRNQDSSHPKETGRTLLFEEPAEIYETTVPKQENIKQSYSSIKEQKPLEEYGKIIPEEKQQPSSSQELIESKPNEDQTDSLKILFTPTNDFAQAEQYRYPVVKMPKPNSNLKLPRIGRSNQKGYKENDFYKKIKSNISEISIEDNVHMVIPHFNRPYEPDIVLYDKNLNLYIDIEIDEPYDGYYRHPTHHLNYEEQTKQDDTRDLFFTESGWVVIRFTEKQVHCQPDECIDYIQNVLNSIYNKSFTVNAKCDREKQWDSNQSIQWEKINYRENYLGIPGFNKQNTYKEIVINTEETEEIESVLQRTEKKFQFESSNNSLAFDEETHKYIHPKDKTGNAEYISVTTLIERFFPFDLKRYIEKKAEAENRTEEEVEKELNDIKNEAAEKGTYLHNHIENFFTGKEYNSNLIEFTMFLNFYNNEIKKKDITFFDAEKMIYSDKYNVAGTVDCLFKKNDKDEYIMFDWKRSKQVVIDGLPKKFGFGYALSELSNLDNSSYYKYCLQQNIYKHILENEFSIKISSMKLVVLHEKYSDYHILDVPVMDRETKIILNSLKHKI